MKWHLFTPCPNGFFLPKIAVKLKSGSFETSNSLFLVDTGAAKSFAPLYLADELGFALSKPIDSGLEDVNGQPVVAVPRIVDIFLPGIAGSISEEVWFGATIAEGLLGQSCLLESVAAHFRNSPSSPVGRCFQLYRM